MIQNYLKQLFDLSIGEDDKDKVLENVNANVTFKGFNIWILACAIVIASIGLNVNSTAVIIGAMLISPLMGPIVGAGFSLAIFDFVLLRKSLKNLFIATAVSLLVATLFFILSPFKETQSEILARTSPNFYDVLIAFFGGLVGVIALTRVDKGNPIPGVAIATALMPPLCTAGYGIAIGNWSYFLGAFFLYTINCVFICISTFIIVKYLRYPVVVQLDSGKQKQIRVGITLLTILLIIPSIYLAYDLLKEKKYTQSIDAFLKNEFEKKGLTLIYKKTDAKVRPKRIELAFLTKKFTAKEIKNLNRKLNSYGIDNTILVVKQDASDIKSQILNEIRNVDSGIAEKDLLIKELEEEIESYKFNDTTLVTEVSILFPKIDIFSFGKLNNFTKENTIMDKFYFIYTGRQELTSDEENKLSLWLKQRFKIKDLDIIYHN